MNLHHGTQDVPSIPSPTNSQAEIAPLGHALESDLLCGLFKNAGVQALEIPGRGGVPEGTPEGRGNAAAGHP